MRLAAGLAAALALAACTPTFNWRETPIGDDGMTALLPCKPDRATRALPLAAASVSVEMAGCEAGGATFAVAHASAADRQQAEAWLSAWRAALAAQLGGTRGVEGTATVARAALTPAPVRLDMPAIDGTRAATHVLWFAQARGAQVSLYQATVVGTPSSPEALSAFFEGLHLP